MANNMYTQQKKQIVEAIAIAIDSVKWMDGGGEFDLDFVFRNTRFNLTPKGELTNPFSNFPFKEISTNEVALFKEMDEHFHKEKRAARRASESQYLEDFLSDTLPLPK